MTNFNFLIKEYSNKNTDHSNQNARSPDYFINAPDFSIFFMTNFNFMIKKYSNQKHRPFQQLLSEVFTISLMLLTEQYRAYLYKAYKCPDNNLIQINDITIHIVLYDPFSNLPLIELLQIMKPVKGRTSSITLYSTNINNF